MRALEIEFEVDDHLVRGLDYYSDTVFEFEHAGARGPSATVLAGGRYDHLVSQLGGPPVSAVGWAAGIDRLEQLADVPADSVIRVAVSLCILPSRTCCAPLSVYSSRHKHSYAALLWPQQVLAGPALSPYDRARAFESVSSVSL